MSSNSSKADSTKGKSFSVTAGVESEDEKSTILAALSTGNDPSTPTTGGGMNSGSEGMENGGFQGSNGNSGVSEAQQAAAANKNRVCRDFIRGLCRRKHCKYPHVLSPDLVVFCHDFQNTVCPRINCKFLHYSIEEEEYYRKFGEFPQSEDKELLGHGGGGVGGVGVVGRYRDLRFRPRGEADGDRLPPGPPMGYRAPFNDYIGGPRDFSPRGAPRDDFAAALKRSSGDRGSYDASFKRFREDTDQQIDVLAIIRKFEEEQAMLRRRVEANEIKIAELRASNEYLMTQNAQLRLNTVQVSRVVNPVTVTQTTAQQPQPTQVINAVSMAPVQVATPIVSMTTPQQPQLIANNAPQLAIAANTSQGQQLTITQPNLSTLNTSTQQIGASQILGTSQITLTPTLAPAPSMGLAINTSQPLQISNASQPIISYPVMATSILPH